jgi:hypothetical protein
MSKLSLNRRVMLSYMLTLGSGAVFGGAVMRNVPERILAADATPPMSAEATATRAAELDDFHDLQTRVAQQPVCTPAATATVPPPTATATEVPLASVGTPLPYLDIWSITVLGIAPIPVPGNLKATGKFMQVNLTASHSRPSSESLMLTNFSLRDSAGRYSIPNIGTNQAILGGDWGLSIAPGVTQNKGIIFDVAKDAGDSFILESNADPTFRVAMTVEQRG